MSDLFEECPSCHLMLVKGDLTSPMCNTCHWFNDNSDVLYMLDPTKANCEELIFYKNKEDAIAGSIKYYKIPVQIFKKGGDGYKPSNFCLINGRLFQECSTCSFRNLRGLVNSHECKACHWFIDKSDFIYMLAPNKGNWEELILYKNKEDAIAASIKYYEIPVQIFYKGDDGYEPTEFCYIHGKIYAHFIWYLIDENNLFEL